MLGVGVKDGFDVAGVDKILIIFLYLYSNTCITHHYQLNLTKCASEKIANVSSLKIYQPRGELGWWSGVVVSTLALINEVNLSRTRLVLRWMTVSGSIPGAGHLFQYVTNQPPKANSAFHPSGVGK